MADPCQLAPGFAPTPVLFRLSLSKNHEINDIPKCHMPHHETIWGEGLEAQLHIFFNWRLMETIVQINSSAQSHLFQIMRFLIFGR